MLICSNVRRRTKHRVSRHAVFCARMLMTAHPLTTPRPSGANLLMRAPIGLDYFHAFEDDLTRVARYIEFCPDNYGTYSLELVRLLLAAGSEVDVALKELCKVLQPTGAATKSINQHKAVILGIHPEIIHKQTVHMPRFDLELMPWRNWPAENPAWWRAYNSVKHNRVVNYKLGNLENTINAVAGLGIVMQFVAGATLPDFSNINFRGTVGGLFSGLRLTKRTKPGC